MVDPVAGPFRHGLYMGGDPNQWGCRGNTKVAKHLGIVANEIEEMSEQPPGIPTQEIRLRYRGGDMILVIQSDLFGMVKWPF